MNKISLVAVASGLVVNKDQIIVILERSLVSNVIVPYFLFGLAKARIKLSQRRPLSLL